MRDITLEDTIYIGFTTRAFATGIPTVLAGTPVVSAYENADLTQITAGITLGIDHDSVVGFNMLTVVATAANGYEAGKDYNLVVTTGTVDSVSVVGEVVGQFTIARSAAAVDLANGTDGLGAIKADTAATLVDTAVIGALGAGLTDLGGMSTGMKAEVNAECDTAISDASLATAANLATVDTVVDSILVDTAVIGAAGAGLTDLGGMSTGMKGEVNAECDTAISDASLATATNLATVDTVVDSILVDTAVIGALGAGLTDLGGMSTGMKAEVNAEADTAVSDYGALKPTTASRTLDVTAAGTAGIDWGNVENKTTVNDLSATDIQLCDTVTALTGHTVQTGDGFARLGAPAGASVSADVAAVKVDTAATLVDTAEIGSAGAGLTALASAADLATVDGIVDAILVDTGTTLDGRIPAALVDGKMSSDAVAISGSTGAADKLQASAEVIVTGAAIAGTLSTTQMTTDLAEVTDDHFNGRVIIWKTGVLKDQASDITDYDGASKMFTYTAVTESPSAADTFVIV